MIKEARGPIRWILRKTPYWGICLPPFGVYILKERMDNERLIRHEQCHWDQYLRMGVIKFYAVYLYKHFKYGYENNPLEVEARQAEDSV